MRCSNFLGVNKTTPMESVWNVEKHYLACKFTQENHYPCLGNPEDVCACYDYVRNKVKWHSSPPVQAAAADNINVRPVG
jgi:hypothetical protein